MHHSTTIKVRGYHCDFYGHVNNARYLEFLEEAREVREIPAGEKQDARPGGPAVAQADVTFAIIDLPPLP